ncbi:MAG: phage tail tape measure protein [Lachnospiraceae bacterium]|nr:phage tail tape measure protein [Lachnospiraceae bacterium]
MANREYLMQFMLDAKLKGNFSNTMSQAQKKLQAVSKEIQALSKTQSDVKGYEKQEQSIAQTNSRLELYKKQLENVRREMAQNGSEDSTLANRELELQKRIQDTEASLVTKNERLAEMRKKLGDAGVNVDKLSEESARLSTQMDKLREEEEKAAEEARKFGASGAAAFEAVGSALVAAGITAALSKIAEEYKECVELSMQFGSTMSTVEALSGASAAEMKQLSDEAKRLGATTAYTANQSAEAMTYMGMAGWDASQIISGMDGVLNLAAASGENLSSVSDIVTDNLTAFGLTAKDTAHFADVLAAAATNSNTSVGIMGETFKGSASVAGALGYSIEDVSTAVGLMANAGIKGSVAGTALKNTFNGLLEGATLTAKSIGEVEYTSIKADGTMKSFGETCDELRGYFEQMTEAERVQNAMTIAGQRGYNGLLAILNATEGDYEKLRASIENCTGSAQKMANIKLDNLAGDVTLLNSATDGLKMTVGGLYEDEFRGLVQTGTEIISKINEFCEANPAVVKGLMAIVAEVGLLVAGYTAFTTVKKVKNSLDTIGAALGARKAVAAGTAAVATGAEAAATTGAAGAQKLFNTTLLASPITWIVAGVAALTAGLVALREACKQEAFETKTLSTATEAQYREVERLNSEYETAAELYGETSDQARALKYDLDEATAAIDAQSFSVKDLYAEIDTLHSSTSDLLGNINGTTSEINSQYDSAMILSAKLKELASSSDKSASSQAKMAPIVERLNSMYPSLGLSVENVSERLGDLNDQIERAAKSDSLQAKYDAAKENLADLYTQQEKLQEAAEKADAAQARAGKAFSDAVGDNIFSAAGGLITGRAQTTEKEYDEAVEKARTAREDLRAIEEQIAACEAAMVEYGDVVSGTSSETVSAYDAVAIAINDVTTETEELLKAYNDAYNAAYESVSGQYALWDEAAEVSAVSAGTINKNLEQQAAYWSSYNDNINALLGKSDEIEGLRDMIGSFADGSKDSVNAIAGMAAVKNDEELVKMVENWKKVQAEQEATAKALAETKLDFDGQLEELIADTEDAFKKMNMSDTARTAANDTMTAYAEAIMSGKGAAIAAADYVAAATASALNFAANPNTTYGPQIPTIPGHSFASGTDYAPAGIALVGEKGPELVRFRGGESVVNAENTRAILRNSGGSGAVYNISPSFVINGNADRGMLEDFSAELVELINDTIDRRSADARRGAYV